MVMEVFIFRKKVKEVINEIYKRVCDYSYKLLDRVYNNLGKLEDDIKNKNVDNTLEKFFKDWEKDEKILSLYMEHSEIEKVSTVVRNLKTNLETDNYLNVEEEVDEIKFRLDYIRNKQRLNLKNIF